mgnify:CR=1 FL=1
MANIMPKSLLFDKTNMLNRLEIEFSIQKHHILWQFVIRRSLFRPNSVDEYKICVDKNGQNHKKCQKAKKGATH